MVFSEASYLGYKLVISKTESVHEEFFKRAIQALKLGKISCYIID